VCAVVAVAAAVVGVAAAAVAVAAVVVAAVAVVAGADYCCWQEWTQLQLSSTPGFLIASEPPIDVPTAYFGGSAWADCGYASGCPWDCRACRGGSDSHHDAYDPVACHPSYHHRVYLVASYVSPFACDCRTTHAPLPSPAAVNPPGR